MSKTSLKQNVVNHIFILAGIVWIMMNLFFISSEARTIFEKETPKGVMSTAVKNQIAVSWELVSGASGYEIYEAAGNSSKPNEKLEYTLVKITKDNQCVLDEKAAGVTYYYYIKAYKSAKQGGRSYSQSSDVVSTTVPVEGTSTIKNFLKTAIAPVGSTMYVWGGGWNKADTGAGKDAKRIGLSPAWRKFASNKTSSYNYKNYRYQIQNGLDCSGYVGWAVYNVLHTQNNKKGYVYSASKQAKQFSKLGFGSYRKSSEVKDYKAGDIMSSTCSCCGHVWIVIGECKDGSVVLIHSSPAGVQINGTVSAKGKKNSQAVKLAKKYMKKYYKNWYKRYSKVDRGSSYLSHYGQMRWKTTGNHIVLSDPDGYQNMSPEDILKDLFAE